MRRGDRIRFDVPFLESRTFRIIEISDSEVTLRSQRTRVEYTVGRAMFNRLNPGLVKPPPRKKRQ